MVSPRNVKWMLLLMFGTVAIVHYLAQAQQAGLAATAPVLQELSHAQLLQVMRDWAAALGVDCRYCHQDSFAEETSRKQIARRMQREYVAALRRADGSAINCQDCHQGQPKVLSGRARAVPQPSAGAAVVRAVRVKLKSAGVVLWRASKQVPFLPKKHFMEEMLSFNRALGVNCSYCHRQGDYETETPRKQMARFMMQEFSAKLTKPDGQPVRCNDCHQGRAHPLTSFKTQD
jgi:nitrate/TMAO reductase-like tetraheme cytochrome c subunit